MSYKARQRAADRKKAKYKKKVANIGKPATGLCLLMATSMVAAVVGLATALWRKR